MPKKRKHAKRGQGGPSTPKKQAKRGPYSTYNTPQRAKLQGIIEYLKAKGFPPNETDVFDFFGVKERTAWDIVKPGAEVCVEIRVFDIPRLSH